VQGYLVSELDFQECTRKLDFYRLPAILVLQLKRFHFGKHSKRKLNTKVTVPSQLDLAPFLTHSSHKEQKCSYRLVGVVHHSGDIDFGHYTADCLNPADQQWYNYNDAHVGLANIGQSFQSSTPYLLFYAKNNH
jgi:ubiquitin C-terminal hydrolase